LADFTDSWFGYALAAGDADNDGDDELAIGAPFARKRYTNTRDKSGSFVVVNYRALPGPDETCFRIYEPDGGDIGARRGAALAMGDFNGNGTDDLAVGLPSFGSGMVEFYHGKQTFLNATCDEIGIGPYSFDDYMIQGTGPIHGHARVGDNFGASLAAADFDDDGDDEIAIGSPGEDRQGFSAPYLDRAGMVRIAHPFHLGNYAQALSQFDEVVPDEPAANEQFGYTLVTGNFDRDNGADLAVSVPFNECGPYGNTRGGAYEVFYSDGGNDSDTLSRFGVEVWHQDKPGVPDTCETNDAFGMVVGFLPRQPAGGFPGF
jgi:hypothetical protein